MAIMCPKCCPYRTHIYTKKDGTRRCTRCGYEAKAEEFEFVVTNPKKKEKK